MTTTLRMCRFPGCEGKGYIDETVTLKVGTLNLRTRCGACDGTGTVRVATRQAEPPAADVVPLP